MTIEAKNLLKIYGRRKVVNDVDVNVDRGEVVGLLGPNGAGKTTTFYMVVGLIKPNKGSIFLDGKNISKSPMYKRARLGLGYLPQEASVFRKLTVEENILAIWQLRGGAPKLSLSEKIELVIRKSERSWWKREKYEKYYNGILNDIKLSPEEHNNISLLGEIKEFETKGSNTKHPVEKAYYIYKIIENLGLDFQENREKIGEFLSDYGKFYKLGKKKKLEEFINLLWKSRRDLFYSAFKASNKSEKVVILKEITKCLDFENESLDFEIDNMPEIDNSNQLIEFTGVLEKIYWTQRKKPLFEKAEELKKIENMKSSAIQPALKEFMESNGFLPIEIKETMDIVNWSARHSKHVQLEDILDEFNISHIRHSKGSELSGGERRRVEIARAVANKPSFLLLDEPFAGIDPIAVAGIKEMIVLLKNRNIGVLITDHNVRETLKIIDRGYILSDGRVIEKGTKEHLANSEVARKHYLGEDFSL